jgi:two-component system, OmpR family, sensor kinase
MSGRRRTLRTQIVWTTVIVCTVAMTLMVLAVLVFVSTFTRRNIDAALNDRVGAASATLSTTSGVLTELETPDESIDETTWLFDVDGSQLAGPDLGATAQRAADSLSHTETRRSLQSGHRRFLAAPVDHDGETIAVVVASEDLRPYKESRREILIALIALGVVVVAGSAGVAAWTVRRALQPVDSMATLAEDWSEHDLESRFESTGGDEISRLGRTLNVLLDRVAHAIRGEQQLTSELAHELRTPLAAIRGEAELGSISSELEPDVRFGRVIDLTDAMDETIGALLAFARGHVQTDNRTNAFEVVDFVVSALTDLPGVKVVVDRGVATDDVDLAAPLALAARSLAPLVDNATRAGGSTVKISSRRRDRMVDIVVSDDGPGLPDRNVDDLFQAGVRGADSQGAGLGLPLALRVARVLGGDVTVESTRDPTTVALTLPRF